MVAKSSMQGKLSISAFPEQNGGEEIESVYLNMLKAKKTRMSA